MKQIFKIYSILITMNNPKIFQYIKTECGRLKYERLSKNKSFIGKLRLYWFIVFASLADLNIKN